MTETNEKHFSDRQKKMLESLMQKRQESAAKAGMKHLSGGGKPKVTRDEYQRRLAESLREDERIIEQTSSDRISKAMEQWAQIVGPRFEKATIENERIKSLVMEKVDRIENHGPLHRNSLVLSGILGNGKTWTAYAYARELVSKGLLMPTSLVEGTESSLLTPLALAGFERPDKIYAFLNANKKFYIIDEVGRATFRTPEIRHEIWYELINHVYEKHIPIVLTTNKSTVGVKLPGSNRVTNELEMWIGEAAYDRLRNIADIIVPGNVNQREKVGRLMDEGEVLGLNKVEKPDVPNDPFSGISEGPPPSSPVVKTHFSSSRPIGDLRPNRR